MALRTATVDALRNSPRLVARAVRSATPLQAAVTVGVGSAVAALIGVATVLIPNDVFGREIAPVAWNYPVWILTALLSGLLAATYVRPDAERSAVEVDARSGRFGILGTVATWFAVGCPVCNKLALLVLGYSGAQTWFAPMQPVLGVLGLALLWTGLALRLSTREQCPAPALSTAKTGSA